MSRLRVYEPPPAAWVEELSGFLRIPSVSADVAHQADVLEAGRWVADFLGRSGGTAGSVDTPDGPLVVGTVPASSGATDSPRITLYGHYDVQPAEPLDDWITSPFDPQVRDGWIYARGATDNKGNFYCLLKAVQLLHQEGRLPTTVQILAEGQEEVGGQAIVTHLRANDLRSRAFVSFDSSRMQGDKPMLYVGMRGLVYLRVRVRSGRHELHSGMYGGAALNALNALHSMLATVVPLPRELRSGGTPLSPAERRAFDELDPTRSILHEVGATPAGEDAERDFAELTLAQPSIDIHGIAGGSPVLQKTIVAPYAEATLSTRTAPGQAAGQVAAELRQLLLAAAPAGTECEVEIVEATSGYVQDPEHPTLRRAAEAIERGTGRAPLTIKAGGTIPILDLVAHSGTPIVLTGFGMPDSNIHAANERFRLTALSEGVNTAKELLLALSE